MTPRLTTPPLEMWGGVECTLNRVGDVTFDQLERSGHGRRIEDLDLLRSLGIKVLRYPVLWERVAPESIERADWRWPDERLARLREHGVSPMVTLLHHGSGPRDTSLVDPAFPELFAAYAGAVAARYPWVTHFTPINEPLTTARFSALYGHWYPHARDDRAFARAVVNQCRATALAMMAIRRAQPNALLVQTEDLGRTYSTPPLVQQTSWENERRWLTFDLLTGRIAPDGAMWEYLRRHGIREAELHEFRDAPCAPDILGLNHYLTSERFLDHRTDLYPEHVVGGNGAVRYADVEAVRILPEGIAGPTAMLMEAWDRYALPLAMTEVHVGATREQQLRWLRDVWSAAQDARRCGADVRAITAWSLFGAFDWNSLVTRDDGHYEPGAFDVRGPAPRPTAVAAMIRSLASSGDYDHPVVAGEGWWRRESRILYGFSDPLTEAPLPDVSPTDERRPLLVVGATGTLGRAFAHVCADRDIAVRLCGREEMELTDRALVAATLDRYRPWAVVNAAGYVRVDDAERDAAACFRDNCAGPAVLAQHCDERRIQLLTFSSDLVFDGTLTRPYRETDSPRPLSVYGRSKADSERSVLDRLPSALVVRTSAFFGPWDDCNFLTGVLRSLDTQGTATAVEDQIVSPTYVPDLVHAALDLLIDGESGIWHLANAGAVSWADLARRAARLAGYVPELIVGCPGAQLGRPAQRPQYSVLGSDRGMHLPSLDDALYRFIAARAAPTHAMSGAAQ